MRTLTVAIPDIIYDGLIAYTGRYDDRSVDAAVAEACDSMLCLADAQGIAIWMPDGRRYNQVAKPLGVLGYEND